MLSTFDPVCKCCVVVAYIVITGSQWVKCGRDAMFSFSRKVYIVPSTWKIEGTAERACLVCQVSAK